MSEPRPQKAKGTPAAPRPLRSRNRGAGGQESVQELSPPSGSAAPAPKQTAAPSHGDPEYALAGADRILAKRAEAIAAEIARRAVAGDMAAARLAFDRLFPGSGERRLKFELRRIDKSENAVAAMGDVMQALAEGQISLNEAERIFKMLHTLVAAQGAMIFGGASRQAYKAERTRQHEAELQKSDDAIPPLVLKDLSDEGPVVLGKAAEKNEALTATVITRDLAACGESREPEGLSAKAFGSVLKLKD